MQETWVAVHTRCPSTGSGRAFGGKAPAGRSPAAGRGRDALATAGETPALRENFCNAQRFAGETAVYQAPDAQGIGILQLLRQGLLREALEADGTPKAENREGTHRSGTAVRRGGIWATVDHGVADFHSGGEAIKDDAADLGFQNLNEVAIVGQVLVGAVNGGGEVAFESTRQLQ